MGGIGHEKARIKAPRITRRGDGPKDVVERRQVQAAPQPQPGLLEQLAHRRDCKRCIAQRLRVLVRQRHVDRCGPVRRIDSAARKVCDYNKTTTGTRIPDKEARECVAEAKKKIEKRIAALTEKDKEVAGS